jgi:hypothetical protein
MGAGLILAPSAAAAPPANDAFPGTNLADALPVSTSGTNAEATLEAIDPATVASRTTTKTVWWSWTAPISGAVKVSTCNSDFDTLLGVYTGDSSPLTVQAENDDNPTVCGTRAHVQLEVVEDTTYRILVDGFSGATGTIALAITEADAPPPNDNFPGTDLGEALPTSFTGTNVSATKQPDEPATIAGNPGGASVWWSWTAPVTDRVRVQTCGSNFDTLLGVYTGDVLPVALVGEADDGCGSGSVVEFEATAGVVYRILVDGHDPPGPPEVPGTGQVELDILLAPDPPEPPPPPPNDDLEDAEIIVNNPDPVDGFTFEGNRFATKEPAENNHAGDPGGHSIWYSWTAHETGEFVARTCGSDLNSILGVYADPGDPGPFPLTELGSNDNNQAICGGGSNDAAVTFNATAGDVYKLAIDGKGGATTAGLMLVQIYSVDDLPPPPPAPPNDAFPGIDLGNELPATTSGTNVAASKQEVDPPLIAGAPGGATVWWSWTSPVTDTVRIQTCGSNFDTLLGVYTDGSPLDAVAANDDSTCGIASIVDFPATAGVTYRILVDGLDVPGEPEDPSQGDISLSIGLTPDPPPGPVRPSNDDFAAATALSGQNDSATGDNRNATAEAGEPNHYTAAGSFPRKSIWYSWTAPRSGEVTVSLCESPANLDSVLAAYSGSALGALTPVENDDDACTAPAGAGPSRVSFPAQDGATYWFAVDSYEGKESQAIKLDLQLVPESRASDDAVDPETSIVRAPDKRSNKRKVKFKFRSNEDEATFECARKNRPFRPCTSPAKVKAQQGRNKFYVRAIDEAGNVDDTPATYAWRYVPGG